VLKSFALKDKAGAWSQSPQLMETIGGVGETLYRPANFTITFSK